MEDGEMGRRYLLRVSGLLVALTTFVTPAAAQDPTVFGFSPTVQGAIASLFFLNIGIILLVMLDGYTERTTDVILDDPKTALVSGLWAALVLLGPYAALVGLTVLFDAVGVAALVFLTVIATPILAILLTAIGIGFVAAGRRVNEKEGVVLIVVAALAAPIGAFPLPFALLAAALTLFGLGAMGWDLLYGESELEAQEHDTYGQQHRYF